MRTTPAPEDLSPYYATDLAATMSRDGHPLFAALRRVALGRELGRMARHGLTGPFVDVGCGSGDLARVIARRGSPVVAADAGAEPPPTLGAASPIPYVRFDFDTYELLELPVSPFTVVLRHVLEHVRDPEACLRELRRQGATAFYVVVPNAACIERRLLGADWYLWDPPRHLWHFDAASLSTLCRRAGLPLTAHGFGTAPTLAPSVYRRLRRRGWPAAIYERFGPTSLIAALSSPLGLLLPGNVLWAVACSRPEDVAEAPRITPDRDGAR